MFCDDTIVRGTQLGDTFGRLYRVGAKEIHLRMACPPLLFGCRFLNFSRSRYEMDLAARRAACELKERPDEVPPAYLSEISAEYAAMTVKIAKSLALTSLRYQTVEGLLGAIGTPRSKVFTYCWTSRDWGRESFRQLMGPARCALLPPSRLIECRNGQCRTSH